MSILQHDANTFIDPSEAAKIQRKRMRDEQRKSRIFNSKTYAAGLNKDEVQKQIEERRLLQEEEKKQEEEWFNLMKSNFNTAMEMDKKLNEERRRIEKEMEQYRIVNQKKEYTREWDLNSKDYVQKCAIVEDKLGPSAAQRFTGEDTMLPEKRWSKIQKQRNWLQDQMKEKMSLKQKSDKMEEVYSLKMKEFNAKLLSLQETEERCRKQMQSSIQRYNAYLANQKKIQEDEEKKRELSTNKSEVQHSVFSDFFTENPEAGRSPMDPQKFLPDRFKGMSVSELNKIRLEQSRQIEEKKESLDKQSKEEGRWDEYMAMTDKISNQAMEELRKRKQQVEKEVELENQRLAEEQRKQQSFLNNSVYKAPIDEEFFSWFNKSAR